MRKILLAFFFVLASAGTIGHRLVAQGTSYSLPNDNNNCPANCRTIPWLAGSDVWNGGTLAVYPTGTTCTGLTEGKQTSTDNTSAINSCISSTTSGKAAVIPAGIYYVNGQINLKDGVVLRGAGGGPGAQGRWLNGADPTDTWDNPGGSSGYWGDTLSVSSPAAITTTLYMGASATMFSGYGGDIGTLVSLTGGYTKGSTAVTSSSNPSSSGITTGAWVFVAEQNDPAIPVSGLSACGYCGLPYPYEGTYLMSQIAQVTSVTGSGPYTIHLSRPLYYTFQAGLSPIIAQMTGTHLHQGVENLRLAGIAGSNGSRNSSMINAQGWVEGWVKGVEAYNGPNVSDVAPFLCQYCYGSEVRDSYFHYGGGSGSNGSGANYCAFFFTANSDNKIENNVCREMRHGMILEGGGSGDVYLYNYVDDLYDASVPGNTDTFINNARVNHGAHPYMILHEGNVYNTLLADEIHGTSSHFVLFRNWIWGDSTGNRFNWAADGAAGKLYNYVALQINDNNNYYSAIGNVLGTASGYLPGSYHAVWSGGTVLPGSCVGQGGASAPQAYNFGCDNNGAGTIDATTRNTTILHGNYDYKTKGVTLWDGGSNHTLPASLYYTNEPAFFGTCAWPSAGPDVSGIANANPAEARYLQNAAACGTGGSGGSTPPSPAISVKSSN